MKKLTKREVVYDFEARLALAFDFAISRKSREALWENYTADLYRRKLITDDQMSSWLNPYQ